MSKSEIDPMAEADPNAPDGFPDVLWNRIPPKMRKLMTVMQDDNGIANILQQPVYGGGEDGEPTTSQAEVIADMFNIMRLDVKALGEAVGEDISVRRMTPESAAAKLQGLVKGESFELIEDFNELEDKRERILLQLTDEETVEEHQQMKLGLLFSDIADEDGTEEEDG